MSVGKDSGVASMRADKGSLWIAERSRMEVQWLKWERGRLSSELKTVKKGTQPETVSECTPKRCNSGRS